ncbi:MAG: Fe-S protein assembly co-chaperone HscB [Bryobacteraceae bacterium]|nr:Fe-S protein assembly co-chaperone HscB [Bryobacteraceae bacterium]
MTQAPPREYFEFFGLAPALSLDAADLQKRFYELSRKWHPDRFSARPPEEQQIALDATATLNDAYRTLRDPVRRAEYVLTRNGFPIGEQRTKDVPPELLEEVFELNMALEELRSGDSGVRPQLESAREHFLSLRAAVDGELEELFRSHDSGGGETVLSAIRGVLNRRRYIENLVREVEKALGARATA